MEGVVIGKRVQIGAALTSTAIVLGKVWPEHLELFVTAAVPITFIVQVLIAKFFGVSGPAE